MRVLIKFFLLFLTLNLLSCSSSKSVVTKTIYNDYSTFRAQQKSFVSADGILKYSDIGEGKPILLIHGVPTSSWAYRKMIKSLSANGFRVIAPDMLGFGSSASPDGYDVYSHKNHGKRILALMESLGIKNWNHVLHDAGGFWSYEMLKLAPNKVNNLIFLNTLIFEEGFNPPIKMKEGGAAKISMWAYRNGITTKMILNNFFKMSLNDKKIPKSVKEGYKKPLREKKTKGMYYFFTQTSKPFPNYSSLFQSLKMPKLLIWGKHDNMLQIEPQKEKIIKELNIRPSDLHLLDASHLLMEEKAEEITDLIKKFIK